MAERAVPTSKPERFSPGKDFKRWLMRFEAFATLGKIKDEEMAFAMINFFDDRALDALEALNISEDDMKRYKDVVRGKLLQRFAPVSVERSRLSQELQTAQAKANTLLQQAKTEYEHEVMLERLRAKELERQVSQLTKQVLDLEHRCTTKDAEFDAYRKQLLNRPETTLQAQVNMLQLEKGELERKLSAVVKSKQHYKEQWTKALRELAAVRQKEQAAARERLHRQQKELEMMRAQFLQQETQQTLRSQLEEVKSEVNSLQQHTLAKKHQEPPSLTVEEPVQPSRSSEGTEKDSEVARWIEERDILLQTGVYTSADPTIQRLDQRIREALAQQTRKT